MAEDTPEPTLLIRSAGHTIRPSQDDTAAIREAVAAITEIFQSLLRIAADDQTTAALLSAGNGEAHSPTPGDLQEITQRLHDALAELPGTKLNVDNLRDIQSDLDNHAGDMRQLFETHSEQVSPALTVTGALFAGLSDAAGALDQLVHLVEETIQKSGEGS